MYISLVFSCRVTNANSVVIFNYSLNHVITSESYNKGIGTCMTNLTDSDTTENIGIGSIPIQIPGIGAALYVSQYTHSF